MIDIMDNKYNINFTETVVSSNVIRLINQVWKLLPMLENNEEWEKQLNTVILEIVGLNKIFYENPQFLQLLAKLEGVRDFSGNFQLFRKTIFEIISLLRGLI